MARKKNKIHQVAVYILLSVALIVMKLTGISKLDWAFVILPLYIYPVIIITTMIVLFIVTWVSLTFNLIKKMIHGK